LLLVSHDRDFLDRLVTSVIAVEGAGEVQEYVGGYSDYAIQRGARPGANAGAESKAKKKEAAAPPPEKPRSRKLSFKQQRELEQLPQQIDDLTARIKAASDRLANPDFFSRAPAGFQETSEQIATLHVELEAAEERWLELEALREELESQP